MQEAAIVVNVSTGILDTLIDQTEIDRRVNEWLVFSLFVEERVSSGKAAKLLNMSRIDFLKLLHKQKITYIDYSPDELAEELATVEALGDITVQ